MYRALGEVTLKDGTPMEVGVILAPDPEHADEIRPFLQHKSMPYQAHIQRSVVEPLDALETRFYVGKVDGRIIANVMTVEYRGCGILGHVYTRPEFRRRGACHAIMTHQMADFRARGGRALYLGTGFDTPPYHIYRRHGFRSVVPGSGFMVYTTHEDFERRYFAPRPAHVRPVRWEDWGPLNALTGMVGGDWLRSVRWRMEGPTNNESGFLRFRLQLEAGELAARVLSTDDGAIVGIATLGDHPLWREVQLLDLFCHPNFYDQASALLEPLLAETSGPVVAYADEESVRKVAALQAVGFRPEARLAQRVRRRVRPDWAPTDPESAMDDPRAFVDRPLDVAVFRWRG